MIEHFSTKQVASVERLDFWNGLMDQTYSGLVVAPTGPQFHAQMSRWQLGDLTLVRPSSAAASITRNRSAVGASEATAILHIIQSGVGMLHQRNRSLSFKPGDMVVCAGEEHYRFDMAGDHQVLIVEMQRDMIAERCPELDDRMATVISGEHAATRLLHHYLLSLWREGAANFDAAMGDAYADILLEMFSKSLKAGNVANGLCRNALFERMKGIVEARLDDCTFTPSVLADALGVSMRTLQNAAAENGTTAIAYITERRLEQAAVRLVTQKLETITVVAFASGFSDSAYFSRRFHAHFGVTPTQYRQRH